MSISVQFRIGNKNYWNELHILSTVPLASLARSGFIRYQSLLYFLPGNYRLSDSQDLKLYFVCWTMRIRMHRMRVRKMGIEDYSLACRSVSIHSLSSIGEVWQIISWKFKRKKGKRHDWKWTWLDSASVQKDKTGTHTFIVVFSPSLIIPP